MPDPQTPAADTVPVVPDEACTLTTSSRGTATTVKRQPSTVNHAARPTAVESARSECRIDRGVGCTVKRPLHLSSFIHHPYSKNPCEIHGEQLRLRPKFLTWALLADNAMTNYQHLHPLPLRYASGTHMRCSAPVVRAVRCLPITNLPNYQLPIYRFTKLPITNTNKAPVH